MATSPSLPTYGIACSHNTSSLLKEICTFTQLPLRDWFPSISPWHKWWTTLHLAAWNHSASFSHIPRFPWEEQRLQPGGGHLPAPRGDHPAVLGLMLLQSSSRWTVSESTSLCCWPGAQWNPAPFASTQGQRCPPIALSCVTVNLALVGRKFSFTVFLQQNKTSKQVD